VSKGAAAVEQDWVSRLADEVIAESDRRAWHPSSAPRCSPNSMRRFWLRSTTDQRAALRLLVSGLDEHWSLAGLTAWVYAVPKIRAGMPPDAKAKTPELEPRSASFSFSSIAC
jgi:lysyl-tRNA synthetase class 1